MAKRITKSLLLIGIILFLFHCIVWADGAPPPDPAGLPEFIECPLINGKFTVSYEPFEGENPKYFIIHVVLGETKPYVLRRSVTNESLSICDYQNESMNKLIEKYATEPRNNKIQEDFDLEGVPIISYIKMKGYNCEDRKKAMLKGKLKIRVIPPEFFDRD